MKRYMTILTIAGVFAALLVASAMPAVALSPAQEACAASSGTFVKGTPTSQCILPPVITSSNPGNPQSPNAAAPKTTKKTATTAQVGQGGGEGEFQTTTATTECVRGHCP